MLVCTIVYLSILEHEEKLSYIEHANIYHMKLTVTTEARGGVHA